MRTQRGGSENPYKALGSIFPVASSLLEKIIQRRVNVPIPHMGKSRLKEVKELVKMLQLDDDGVRPELG